MKGVRRLIIWRSIALLAAMCVLVYLLVYAHYLFALLLLPFCLWLFAVNFRAQLRIYRELEEFAEAARYRDFTRVFRAKKAASELNPMYEAFNDINAVLRKISSDREIQYQYLQQILDIVDTAILSYEKGSGKVVWMNKAFQELFGIPYLNDFAALAKRNTELYQQTIALTIGNSSLHTLPAVGGKLKLLLYARDFQTAEGDYRLITYQNVNETIDETESKAWQKLLSVLTHEIMNSIAPIASLADTLKNRLQQIPRREELEDIRVGVQTIKGRSEGLLKFAATYRSLNKIDRLNISRVRVADVFENLYQLMEPTLVQKNIELDIILMDTQLQLDLDIDLIEQVLINLLMNAIEAVSTTKFPYISLSAAKKNERAYIHVQDNGKGIPQDLLENIFIPFFTTRKNGSGIGLTLSKQIMLLHGGNILVDSKEGEGSLFTLVF